MLPTRSETVPEVSQISKLLAEILPGGSREIPASGTPVVNNQLPPIQTEVVYTPVRLPQPVANSAGTQFWQSVNWANRPEPVAPPAPAVVVPTAPASLDDDPAIDEPLVKNLPPEPVDLSKPTGTFLQAVNWRNAPKAGDPNAPRETDPTVQVQSIMSMFVWE
ncbi:hypothetical protein [Tuwongella immobilis]|uniref:Uncharacterized protein n=1 Tax=Tuwongella immobilis TaxID=692036 RepID=A0A6C2YRP2_9BACT|nr:hypothetical protein [Tuwongella immobilis]VIP04330.1 unnamed protein product [Tuwongella immobilis]VTS06022.1 unnamed protein product [Tuwongella immobilis]